MTARGRTHLQALERCGRTARGDGRLVEREHEQQPAPDAVRVALLRLGAEREPVAAVATDPAAAAAAAAALLRRARPAAAAAAAVVVLGRDPPRVVAQVGRRAEVALVEVKPYMAVPLSGT